MDSGPKKLHMVRHGESVWNSERRVQKNTDGIALSPRGRKQAELLGARLQGMRFDRVYCSDVQRALETARIALGETFPLTISSGLREIGFGEWEGKLVREIEEEYPGAMSRWFEAPSKVEIKGAERFLDFHERVVSEIGRIIGSAPGDILMITHGGVICTYLTHILGMSPDDIWAFSLPNASVTTIMLEFRPRLRLLGDAHHLSGGTLGFDGMPSSVR